MVALLSPRYKEVGAEGSPEITSTFHVLLDLTTFFDLYHNNKHEQAYEVSSRHVSSIQSSVWHRLIWMFPPRWSRNWNLCLSRWRQSTTKSKPSRITLTRFGRTYLTSFWPPWTSSTLNIRQPSRFSPPALYPFAISCTELSWMISVLQKQWNSESNGWQSHGNSKTGWWRQANGM